MLQDMSYWLTDPELFLYAKGTGPNDVHLWRCKKPASSSSSSLVVPMESDDFDYVSNVKNHLELVAGLFDWDETDYKRLVKYIFERCLLVNSQGFVIAELLHKDGIYKTIDDANEEVPTIYIRSLDVLALKPYIPDLRERPIPLRTVKYLGDVNGKAAMMEGDSQVTKLTARWYPKKKLTARVEKLEAENTRLESKNNTLDTSVTKLTADLVTTTGNVADLQSKNMTLETENKILEGKVTKLTADLVTQMNALATVQHELGRLQNGKEVWMNDLTDSEWVGIEGIRSGTTHDNLIIVSGKGTFTVDDRNTNIRASYMYMIRFFAGGTVYKAVSLEDLTPNKEKARFSSKHNWVTFKSKGKTYIYGSS